MSMGIAHLGVGLAQWPTPKGPWVAQAWCQWGETGQCWVFNVADAALSSAGLDELWELRKSTSTLHSLGPGILCADCGKRTMGDGYLTDRTIPLPLGDVEIHWRRICNHCAQTMRAQRYARRMAAEAHKPRARQ